MTQGSFFYLLLFLFKLQRAECRAYNGARILIVSLFYTLRNGTAEFFRKLDVESSHTDEIRTNRLLLPKYCFHASAFRTHCERDIHNGRFYLKLIPQLLVVHLMVELHLRRFHKRAQEPGAAVR